MEKLQLKKIITIHGTIRVETGLHVGAGSDKIEIGGMDNPIIRNPFSGEPYIPGSSIKGKLRSLMEWKLNRVLPGPGEKRKPGDPCSCGECDVCRVFGCGVGKGQESSEKALSRGPTRIIVRDAVLSRESREQFNSGTATIIEEKNENSLNRITAEANPRPIERVVPGTEFDFSISYRVLDMEDGGERDERNFATVVLTGLTLLEHDYLGGGGSRGNGRISFRNLSYEDGTEVALPAYDDLWRDGDNQ